MDPCINNVDPEYQPFQRAQTEGVSWIMNGTEPFQARVWPGECFFPDFADQTTRNWWVSEMNSFYENFSEFDGLWIDMNDPSNFKTSRGTAIKPLIEIRDWDDPGTCVPTIFRTHPLIFNLISRLENCGTKQSA